MLAEPPDPNPPKPFATFETHSAPNGLAFSHDAGFGFEGGAFVCLFGDLNPNTTRQPMPAGHKIVRVDGRSGETHDLAVNKIVGPASKLPHGGFERPSHCEFGPDGALYVVDWGEIKIAPEAGGVRMKEGTGTLWRIRRVPGARVSVRPREPRRVPVGCQNSVHAPKLRFARRTPILAPHTVLSRPVACRRRRSPLRRARAGGRSRVRPDGRGRRDLSTA